MPISIQYFDKQILHLMETTFNPDSHFLDVGAGAGRFGLYLKDSCVCDAVEAYASYIEKYRLNDIYRTVFLTDVMDYEFVPRSYDCVLLMDVLEHLEVEKARLLLARIRAAEMSVIIKVPFLWEQDAVDGVDWEIHRQPDLTHALFNERYPGHELLVKDDVIGVYYRLEERHAFEKRLFEEDSLGEREEADRGGLSAEAGGGNRTGTGKAENEEAEKVRRAVGISS